MRIVMSCPASGVCLELSIVSFVQMCNFKDRNICRARRLKDGEHGKEQIPKRPTGCHWSFKMFMHIEPCASMLG